jgi:hypothetical protein
LGNVENNLRTIFAKIARQAWRGANGIMTEHNTPNTSGMGKNATVPDEIKGWSWGGFILNWIWSIGNNTPIGLLALVPYLGFVVCFVLGFKGREWAWRNKRWESVAQFNEVQRKWSITSVIFLLAAAILIAALFVAIGRMSLQTR